jgi:type II secretory pathway pseudopilin PulG
MKPDACMEIEPLLPGYALGALDEEDHKRVVEHLPSCPRCQESLSSYLAVRDGLLLSQAPVHPPPRLRRKLAAATRPAGAKGRFLGSVGLQLPALAGVAVLAVLLAVNLLVLAQNRRLIREQQASLNQLTLEQSRLIEDLQANQTAVALVSYPTSAVARVQGENAYGTFVYDPDLKVAVLYAWGLDPLPDDETYQAWLIDGNGGRSSAGIFQASEGNRFTVFIVNASSPIGDFSSFGVTIEPPGGSSGPTGPRVLSADF